MKKKIYLKNIEKPFTIKLGFAKLFDQLDQMASNGSAAESDSSKRILSQIVHRDELYKGFDSNADCNKYTSEIKILLSVLFPSPLLNNEIKIAIPPLSSEILYATDRFNKIFDDLQVLESKEFSSVDEDMMYIHMCTFILASYYGKPVQLDIPPVYNVKDDRGVIKYYKSTYNAEFMTIRPLGTPPEISDELVIKLKEGYGDIRLWKKIFPPDSWEIGGFGLKSFTHVSNEQALSLIKNNLIGNKSKTDHDAFQKNMDSYSSTLLDVPRVVTSLIMYDESKGQFLRSKENKRSFALFKNHTCDKHNLLCQYGLGQIFHNKKALVISDLDQLDEKAFEIKLYGALRDQGIKSYIMTPLYYEERLLGVLEFSSTINGAFDRTHPDKIDQMKNLSINSIKRFSDERENELTSIIQREFTAIHPSVEWKFREEAEGSALAALDGKEYNFDNITFKNLTALYGQMDISGSSTARNEAIAADLKSQMTLVRNIIDQTSEIVTMPLLESIQYQIGIICEKLSSDLAAGMEQEVIEFLRVTINPLLQQMRTRDERLEEAISAYFDRIGEGMEIIYDKRKDYDDTVQMINSHFAGRLDKEQKKAQQIYPHYFERYKTDGVEHNMFIGQEIAPDLPYNKLYLDNLRLWQLQTLCELEIEHYRRINDLPVPLKVASLIMVYSNPLAIRYRMDEKQFDIDGAYNARYEIIKKRIDKAHIKGTDERVTEPGKIVMIYTQAGDLDEYLNYVNYLAYQGYLIGEPEVFDVEDLQGVVGLKGLRVSVNFDYKSDETVAKKRTSKKRKSDKVVV